MVLHHLIVAYVGSLSIMLGFESAFNQTVFGAYCQLRMEPWLYSLARSGTGGCGTSAPRVAYPISESDTTLGQHGLANEHISVMQLLSDFARL